MFVVYDVRTNRKTQQFMLVDLASLQYLGSDSRSLRVTVNLRIKCLKYYVIIIKIILIILTLTAVADWLGQVLKLLRLTKCYS